MLHEAEAADVDRAVQVAHQALKTSGWSGCAPRERGRALRRSSDFIIPTGGFLGSGIGKYLGRQAF